MFAVSGNLELGGGGVLAREGDKAEADVSTVTQDEAGSDFRRGGGGGSGGFVSHNDEIRRHVVDAGMAR